MDKEQVLYVNTEISINIQKSISGDAFTLTAFDTKTGKKLEQKMTWVHPSVIDATIESMVKEMQSTYKSPGINPDDYYGVDEATEMWKEGKLVGDKYHDPRQTHAYYFKDYEGCLECGELDCVCEDEDTDLSPLRNNINNNTLAEHIDILKKYALDHDIDIETLKLKLIFTQIALLGLFIYTVFFK
jgi:hypothetical protein